MKKNRIALPSNQGGKVKSGCEVRFQNLDSVELRKQACNREVAGSSYEAKQERIVGLSKGVSEFQMKKWGLLRFCGFDTWGFERRSPPKKKQMQIQKG